MFQATLRMAWCSLALEHTGSSINNKNKWIKDLRTKNKTLLTQVENLTKTNVVALSEFSKASYEKKILEAKLSTQEITITSLMAFLASVKKEVQKKEEEVVALQEAYIDKFAEGANHMKTVLF